MLMRLKTLGITAVPVVLGLLAIGTAVNPAKAAYIVNLEQVGSNVVATGSGSIDTADLSFGGLWPSGGNYAQVVPVIAFIVTGPILAPSELYTGFTGPTSFEPGRPTSEVIASSGSGDQVGIVGAYDELWVPLGYVSGSTLSDTSTYDDTTLSSLGVTPGTYVWTWGSGADADSFTLNIGGTATVPEPASLTLFGTAVLSFGAIQRRRRKDARALVSR